MSETSDKDYRNGTAPAVLGQMVFAESFAALGTTPEERQDPTQFHISKPLEEWIEKNERYEGDFGE